MKPMFHRIRLVLMLSLLALPLRGFCTQLQPQFGPAAQVLSDEDEQYIQAITYISQASGELELFTPGTYVFSSYVQMAQNAEPSLSQSRAEGLVQRYFTDRYPRRMAEIILPIYKKHMTQAETKQWVAYLSSPQGQRIAKSTRLLASPELQKPIMDWVQSAAMSVATNQRVKKAECHQSKEFMQVFDRLYKVNNMDAILENMLGAMASKMDGLPNGKPIYASLSTEIRRNARALYAEMYAKAFTLEDMRAALAFSESRLGKKGALVRTEVTTRTAESGQLIYKDFTSWIQDHANSNSWVPLSPMNPDPDDYPSANRIYEQVDKNAQFPGGDMACMEWLAGNIKYPSSCIEEGVEGRVFLSFVVNKDGSIDEVKTIKSPDPRLSEESERVVKAMPKWTPAMVDGKPVRSRFQFPILYRLPKEETPTNNYNP